MRVWTASLLFSCMKLTYFFNYRFVVGVRSEWSLAGERYQEMVQKSDPKTLCQAVRFDERALIRNGSEVIIWQQVDIISFGPVNLLQPCVWKKFACGNLKLRTVNLKIVSTTIQTSVTRSLNYRNSGQTNQIISHIPSRQPWTRVDPNRTHRRFIPTAFPSDPTSSIVVPSFHFVVAIAVTSLVAASDNYSQLPFFPSLPISVNTAKIHQLNGEKNTQRKKYDNHIPGLDTFRRANSFRQLVHPILVSTKKGRKNQCLQLIRRC